MKTSSLKFTTSNSYFGFKVFTFNLPSGYSCPEAKECLAYADRKTGKITNGSEQKFRCYSATLERYPAVRKVVWDNYAALRGKSFIEMSEMLLAALPEKATHVRIHAGGDFFSQEYFDAWLEVCRQRSATAFWAFTKSVPFWVARLGRIPENLALQASYGGNRDDLIEAHGLKYAKVFMSAEEIEESGLPLDINDALAMSGDKPFALLENKVRSKTKKKKHADI